MLVRHLLEKKATEEEIGQTLHDMEEDLDHGARYRSFDVDMVNRIVYWVTQEMEDPDDLYDLAKQIAVRLAKAKCGLWTVKTCVRDNFNDCDDSTKWQSYEWI